MMTIQRAQERPPHRHPGIAPSTRVLVAEEDDALRRRIAWRLQEKGCEVVEARSGLTAMQRFYEALDRPQPFDLLVSAIRIAWLGGRPLTVRPDDAAAPMILVAARAHPEARPRGKRLGAVALFDKPVDLDALVDAVHLAMPRP
jgi:two-component system, response regulator, stage 0 sporulation protein F